MIQRKISVLIPVREKVQIQCAASHIIQWEKSYKTYKTASAAKARLMGIAHNTESAINLNMAMMQWNSMFSMYVLMIQYSTVTVEL